MYLQLWVYAAGYKSIPDTAPIYVVSCTAFRQAVTENSAQNSLSGCLQCGPSPWQVTWLLWFPLSTSMTKILHQYQCNVWRHQCLQLSALLHSQNFITQLQEWQTQTGTCVSSVLVQNDILPPWWKREHSSVIWMNSWGTVTDGWKTRRVTSQIMSVCSSEWCLLIGGIITSLYIWIHIYLG